MGSTHPLKIRAAPTSPQKLINLNTVYPTGPRKIIGRSRRCACEQGTQLYYGV
jgi:hypothetical protein